MMLVELVGSSPCSCGIVQGRGHRLAVVTGVNLAMLLKLATLDRTNANAAELAEACCGSARKSVTVLEGVARAVGDGRA